MSNKIKYILIYTIIPLIIVAPLLNGYIFFLDWINAPEIKTADIFYGLKESVSAGMPFLLLMDLLTFFVSAPITQKISIFLIFFLSGISMHNLIKTKSEFPKYFAGFLYMINPFVYIRFMAGHWHILLAYSILPFVTKSIMKFLDNPDRKQTIKTCLWITLIAAINTHTLFLTFFLFAIFYVYKLIKSKSERLKLTKSISIMAFFFILLNSYWLIPLLTAESIAVSQITSDDLAAFQTKKGNFNEFMETLMMYGFWREDAYILPRNIIPSYIYFPIFALILFLTIHGYLNCKEKYKTPILITGILAQLLAVGVGHPWFREIFTYIFTHVYFMRGFREPQKFVALLVFAYAFFAAYGMDSILRQLRGKKTKILASVLILAIPFAYTPTMFNSFWGQIHTTDYPQDWYEINTYLNQDSKDFNVLFLPWHLYMDFKWIPNKDKRIANPAESFFDKPTIRGDNVEVGTIYSSSNNPRSKYIQSLLKKETENIGERLKLINVKYVILAKETDYKNYFYLFNQSDLELVKETENLYLFKNKNEVNKFYQTDNANAELMPLKYTKKSPIKYTIGKPDKTYIIFTEAFNENWELGSQKPANFIAVNLYEFKDNFILKYKRFDVYMASYIISILAIVLVLFLLLQ
ncbi:MAG: hypothetical protein AABX33_02845 [Nanoarchaeota archaeon]